MKYAIALVTVLAMIAGTLYYVSRGMWQRPPTTEVDAAKIAPPDAGKGQEPAQDRVTTEGERREVGVTEISLASDDPASAGVKRRFLWTVAVSEEWTPAGALTDTNAADVIRLEGGKAYNVRALTPPHRSVTFAFFRPGTTDGPMGFTVDPDALAAEEGIDLYPRLNALLRMRWHTSEEVPEGRLTIRLDLLDATPDERRRERAVTTVEP